MIYQEQHTFWIIGEPEVIPGTDLNEEIDIIEIYGLALVIAIMINGLIFAICKWKGSGK